MIAQVPLDSFAAFGNPHVGVQADRLRPLKKANEPLTDGTGQGLVQTQ